MKTLQKILLIFFGGLSIFFGIAMTIGFITAWATQSFEPTYYHSFILLIGLAISLLGIPAFFYVGWKWIRQAKQIH
jgi:hypothetical protein